MRFETESSGEYSKVWLSPGSDQVLVFKVLTCQEVKVVLSPVYGDGENNGVVEVRIGENDNTR